MARAMAARLSSSMTRLPVPRTDIPGCRESGAALSSWLRPDDVGLLCCCMKTEVSAHRWLLVKTRLPECLHVGTDMPGARALGAVLTYWLRPEGVGLCCCCFMRNNVWNVQNHASLLLRKDGWAADKSIRFTVRLWLAQRSLYLVDGHISTLVMVITSRAIGLKNASDARLA